MVDHYSYLIADFEKISFLKLEILKRAKDILLDRPARTKSRSRGLVEPERRSNQYQWSFNGEFWLDEVGDYVFQLKSKCDQGAES